MLPDKTFSNVSTDTQSEEELERYRANIERV